MRVLLLISAFTAVAAPTSAAVAQGASAENPLLSGIQRCRAETDDAARLLCYDSSVGALVDATTRGNVVLVDREDVRKTRRSLFGFNLPKLPFFGDDDSKDDQPDEIELAIRSVRPIESGKYILGFEDGSTWQTTEARNIMPKTGQKVTIKKAALGSYFIRVGSRSVRAMRTR